MSTLILSAAGQAIGSAVAGPFGGLVGRALGAVAGAAIDSHLLSGGNGTRLVEGPRLKEMDGLMSSEGAGIPRVYGRARIGGQLIWATAFEEQIETTVERGGGGKGGKSSKTITTNYLYFANLAVGLCEGPISFVRRIWADGRELDLSTVTMRVHRGWPNQPPDPLIVAKEAGETPGYGGLAYVVFERLPLAPFGNRVPQMSFEVVRAVPGLNEQVRAVTLIPSSGEFAYSTAPVAEILGIGASRSVTRHQLQGGTDVTAALDHLQALCPNLTDIALVTSWFGDDLRAGVCTVAPRVELSYIQTQGAEWQVAGLTRGTARVVSQINGKAAYGGTPSDKTVIALIRELKARGLRVLLYPFIMMDVPSDNALPDPQGASIQPPYPWRGRITCFPASGRPGSVDGTFFAATQLDPFAGSTQPGDVSVLDDIVTCQTPDQWSFRRFVLHHAALAQAAGGVDAFLIGSEMVGLTRVRSNAGYPFVDALVSLAADVRSMPGVATHLSYAADWTEYGAHVRNGGMDVDFPLDPLWASPAIDAVGIDFYAPLADWRDGTGHADAALSADGRDAGYFRDALRRGEAFDWYYADDAGRLAQNRLPITDTTFGKPWVYRAKDIAGWWSNAHRPRSGGVESGTATAWQPGSKPVWLTEFGVPAVDKGGNAPNVFPDPKSVEGRLPPFSTGARDDLLQARALSGVLSALDPSSAAYLPAANPVRAGGGYMIDPQRIYLWTWDARPFPAFPDRIDVWSDGNNWQTGHWLNGRLEGTPVDRLIMAILSDLGLPPAQIAGVQGFADGYVIDRPMSAREMLEPLARLFGIDAHFGPSGLRLSGRGGQVPQLIAAGDLVPDRDGADFMIRRGEAADMARELRLAFSDGDRDYRKATQAAQVPDSAARREVSIEAPVVTRDAEARRLCEQRLQELWAERETVSFALSPRWQSLEPGDVVALDSGATASLYRVQSIADSLRRQVTARLIEPAIYLPSVPAQPRPQPVMRPVGSGLAYVRSFDLPPLPGLDGLLHLAVAASPWPGPFNVLRSTASSGYVEQALATQPAMVGVTQSSLPPGIPWRWNAGPHLDVKLSGDGLATITEEQALAGGNALALRGPDGAVEVIVARKAELIAPSVWRLSALLRGLGGTEDVALRHLAAGADVAVIGASLVPVTTSGEDRGRQLDLRVVAAGRGAADPMGVDVATIVGARSLMPLAPVHARARRTSAGITLRWIRRTRLDGDAWEMAEVALGEASEAYQLRILTGMGGLLKREVTTSVSEWLYPLSQELADFGAAQTTLTLDIRQISQAVGPGLPLQVSVPVL